MRCTALIFGLLFCGPANADLFSAAGRIEDLDSLGTCSASLISEDVIVTAAHCVSDDPDQNLSFRPGSSETSEAIPISQFVVHPHYASFEGQRFRRLRFDIAVGKLERPVDAQEGVPFSLGDAASLGEGLFVVSWPRGSGPRPRQRRCVVIQGRVPAVVTLGCRVRGGESGAPLVRLTENGVELVAIVNSRAEQSGQAVALASDARLRIEPLLDRFASNP